MNKNFIFLHSFNIKAILNVSSCECFRSTFFGKYVKESIDAITYFLLLLLINNSSAGIRNSATSS